MVKKIIHIILFFCCSAVSLAQNIQIDYPETVVANQQFTIEYSVTGSRISSYSISGNPAELKILNANSPSRSTQNFIQNNNGKRTEYRSTSFTYAVKPTVSKGIISLPIFTIQVDGKKISSEPKKLTIVPTSAIENREKYVASLELSSGSIFEGETVIAELKLYFSEEVNKVEASGLKAIPGLFIKKLEQNGYEQGQSLYNGKLYNHAILARYEIIGDTARTYTIAPIEVTAIKQVVENKSGFYRTTRNIPTIVKTSPTSLKVMSLKGKKSENYLGVFEQLDLTAILPQSSAQSEALELTLQLSGTGSFNTIITPQLKELKKHFNLFDPAVKDETGQTDQGQKGSITYTYTMVPQKSGSLVTDSLSLQFFNATSEQFEWLTIPSFKVFIPENETNKDSELLPNLELNFTAYPAHINTSFGKPWVTLSRFFWILFSIVIGIGIFALQRVVREKRIERINQKPKLSPIDEFKAAILKIRSTPIESEISGQLLQALENYLVRSYPIERSTFTKVALNEFLSESVSAELKALLAELELGEYAGAGAQRLRSKIGRIELIETAEHIIKQIDRS